jgi:FeS assembly SUF system regulator
MRLSNLADYAVVLMSASARHCGGTRTSAATLAEETGVPVATAHKLVHTLVRAGLLHSLRGVGGGVKLARPAAAISLADIIEAVEGPIALTACVDSGRHDCVLEGSCRVQPHWALVNDAVRGALAQISLASLIKPLPFRGGVGVGTERSAASVTASFDPLAVSRNGDRGVFA